MNATEEKVSFLEHLIEKLAYAQQATLISLDRLSEEMREFKDEMRQFKDEMREFKTETERDRKRLNKAWGDLANKMGTIIEDIAAPNIRRLATEEFSFAEVDDFFIRSTRTSRRGERRQREFDVVCAGQDRVIVAEMKSTATDESIQAFANTVASFLDFFPEYEGRALLGIYASWSIPDRLRAFISAAGLYGLAMGKETMEIVVRPEAP